MKLFVTVYNDAALLGHFLRHYENIGVTRFFVAVPPDLRPRVEHVARDHPVTLVHGLDVHDSVSGTSAVSAMRRAHQDDDEWVVIADLDEFIECPSLPHVAAAADEVGANVVRGIMHDRFSEDGRPRGFADEDDLDDVFPIKSRFIREVMGGYDHKGVLVKGRLRPAPGAAHHWFEDEKGFSEVLEISHYKWTATSLDRVRSAYDIVRSRGVSWAEEYRRVLEHYDRHGRFAWETFGGERRETFVPEPPAGRCSACRAALAEAEVAYSLEHFGRPLCRMHQRPRPADAG